MWEEVDRPALKPLPVERYEFSSWLRCTVNIDYHIEVKQHYYSVPYQYARQKVDVRLTASIVEVLVHGKRVASHRRSWTRGFTTVPEHMPEAHRRHAEWTPGRIVRWAAEAGPKTATLVAEVMRRKPHPEQGYRSCLGIMRLGQRYGSDRLEAACGRAVAVQGFSYRSVESILQRGLDRQPLPDISTSSIQPRRHEHEHVRGGKYYQ